MLEQKDIYKSNRLKGTQLSLIAFGFIFLLTVGLFFYNSSLENGIQELKQEITQKETSIKNKKANKLVQIYDLYNLNKIAIARLDSYSDIVSFINHLEQVSKKYSVSFDGFDYKNGELVTTAMTVSNDKGLDYQKTANFVKSYRSSEEALFDLGFINNIETVEDREIFKITLNLK